MPSGSAHDGANYNRCDFAVEGSPEITVIWAGAAALAVIAAPVRSLRSELFRTNAAHLCEANKRVRRSICEA
jgi:hypothetical protein